MLLLTFDVSNLFSRLALMLSDSSNLNKLRLKMLVSAIFFQKLLQTHLLFLVEECPWVSFIGFCVCSLAAFLRRSCLLCWIIGNVILSQAVVHVVPNS